MLLAEICDNAIRYGLQQRIVTDESDVNYGSLEQQVIYGREALAIKKLEANDPFEPAWYSTHYASLNYSMQDNPATECVYIVPPTVGGNINMLTQENGTTNFSIVLNESEYYDTIQCQIPSRTMAFYQNSILKVNRPNLGTLRIVANFSDPREASNFNVDYDNFPMPDSYLPMLYEMLMETAFKFVDSKPVDTKPDSANTLTTPNQQ